MLSPKLLGVGYKKHKKLQRMERLSGVSVAAYGGVIKLSALPISN